MPLRRKNSLSFVLWSHALQRLNSWSVCFSIYFIISYDKSCLNSLCYLKNQIQHLSGVRYVPRGVNCCSRKRTIGCHHVSCRLRRTSSCIFSFKATGYAKFQKKKFIFVLFCFCNSKTSAPFHAHNCRSCAHDQHSSPLPFQLVQFLGESNLMAVWSTLAIADNM